MNSLMEGHRGSIPLFVAGIRYPQISQVSEPDGSGISAVGIWKALKKSDGYPVIVRHALVATEDWLVARRNSIRRNYPL